MASFLTMETAASKRRSLRANGAATAQRRPRTYIE
jgi:hypothetical protein